MSKPVMVEIPLDLSDIIDMLSDVSKALTEVDDDSRAFVVNVAKEALIRMYQYEMGRSSGLAPESDGVG